MADNIIQPFEICSYAWGNGCSGTVIQENNFISLKHETMPPGSSEQMHWHEHAKQLFYILSGTATFIIQQQTILVEAQQSMLIHPKEKHLIKNEGNTLLSFILLSEPSSKNDRFE